MHLRSSSKVKRGQKKNPKSTSSSDEQAIQRRLGKKRQRSGLLKTKPGDGVINKDQRGPDILDLIDNTHETENVAEANDGVVVLIADKGVDESEDECSSVNSSLVSGPSLYYHDRLSHGRCAACQKFYQKARKMKAPINNKQNDPKSLTCDQWILLKKRRRTKMFNAGGDHMIYIQLINERLQGRKGVKEREQCFGELVTCSRPHVYLKRNLRRCMKVPFKTQRKANRRRKRTRTSDNSQGSRVAKQRRLQSNGVITRGPAITGGIDGYEDYNKLPFNQSDMEVSVNLDPLSVTLETKSTKPPPKQERSRFRDLLTRMYGNHSKIVRETH